MDKIKRSVKITSFIAFIVIIICFFIIKSLTETNYGKVNTYMGISLQLDKFFSPKSIKGKPIKEIREYLNKQSTKWSKKSIPFSNIKNIIIDINSQKIPVRIYTPESKNKLPVIIYSHGGSWIAGNLDTHDNVCRKLSRNTKAIVISVDYRLSPENQFPAALKDIYNTFQWAYGNIENMNGNKKLIAIVGDSAGGNLSAALSLMLRDKNEFLPVCQVLIYPSTNIFELNSKSWSYFANKFNVSKEEMEEYISLYVPKKEDRKDPDASPLLETDFKSLPDTFIVTAEIDPLRDEGEAYAEKLKKAGIEVELTRYDGVVHGFINMDKITDKADKCLNQIAVYLQKEFQKYNYDYN